MQYLRVSFTIAGEEITWTFLVKLQEGKISKQWNEGNGVLFQKLNIGSIGGGWVWHQLFKYPESCYL